MSGPVEPPEPEPDDVDKAVDEFWHTDIFEEDDQPDETKEWNDYDPDC